MPIPWPGRSDTFAVDGTLGEDLFEYFSGDTPDTGTVRGTMDTLATSPAAPFALPEITFQGMHPLGVRSFGMTTFDPGNDDDFVFYATNLADEIVYDGSPIPVLGYHNLTNSIDATPVTHIRLGERVTGVVISAEDGDDTIDVTPGDHVSVIVQGGNPDNGSDVLTYYAAGDTELELSTSDIEDSGSLGGRDASFSGIEVVNVVADQDEADPDPVFDFQVTGTTGIDEDVTVTVYDASSGKVELGYAAQRAGQVASEIGSPVIYYNNVGTGASVVNFKPRRCRGPGHVGRDRQHLRHDPRQPSMHRRCLT